MELKELWATYKRRLWIVVGLVVVAVGAAWSLTTWYLPRVYQSSALLIVIPSSGSGASFISTLVTGQQLVGTYADLATNQGVVQKALSTLPWHLSAASATKDIKATPGVNTNLLTISGDGRTPVQAEQLTQAVAQTLMTRVNQLTGTATLKLVNSAAVNSAPIAPKKTEDTLIAGVLGMVLGVGWLLLAEYMDDSISDEESVRRVLNMPVLATIPRYGQKMIRVGDTSSSGRGGTVAASNNSNPRRVPTS